MEVGGDGQRLYEPGSMPSTTSAARSLAWRRSRLPRAANRCRSRAQSPGDSSQRSTSAPRAAGLAAACSSSGTSRSPASRLGSAKCSTRTRRRAFSEGVRERREAIGHDHGPVDEHGLEGRRARREQDHVGSGHGGLGLAVQQAHVGAAGRCRTPEPLEPLAQGGVAMGTTAVRPGTRAASQAAVAANTGPRRSSSPARLPGRIARTGPPAGRPSAWRAAARSGSAGSSSASGCPTKRCRYAVAVQEVRLEGQQAEDVVAGLPQHLHPPRAPGPDGRATRSARSAAPRAGRAAPRAG